MRLTSTALVLIFAAALTSCNDALESAAYDTPRVSNKVEQPLPARLVAEIGKKGMERNAPIMLRIFKEEGKLEVWKAKTNNRFDKVVEYDICAWSGRLGPKVKEGDRQAPEGFYPLTPYHLNPNSKYFLAINTGFPNQFDRANARTGTNLMIHGACSSSGCYSMTDQQIMEIYAFARDAFKGGQQAIQLQAFPFKMTAENMARHRHNPNYEFWKTLKVGYDHFEVTKRPPDVNVCGKNYVFNQVAADASGFNPQGACPAMTTAPALETALAGYNKAYDAAYEKALKKFDGKIWQDPTEAERKALVADLRKSRAHDLAFAPTGSALKAGRFLKEGQSAEQSQIPANGAAAIDQMAESDAAAPPAAEGGVASGVPIPQPNPLAAPIAAQPAAEPAAKRSLWRLWSAQ